MSLSPSIPQPGDVIAGKYQVVSVLGAADASIVFQAERAGSQELVALHWYASGPAGRHASALTEARLTALAHLPQRCGFRVRETLETREANYLVTEWQAGETLEARLTRVGPQPIAEVSRLILPCIRAAHTAQLVGIVHHAIKATTIYVCDATPERAEHAKLLDFELDPAHRLQPLAAESKGAKQRAKPNDARASVRAFGAIMYRALTGRRHSPFETAVAAVTSAKMSPTPLLPPIVRWFVERALSDACEEPFQSLEEMANALESMCAALPEISVRVSEAPHPAAPAVFNPAPRNLPMIVDTTGVSTNLPGPVRRPWATTMRLPRAFSPDVKSVPARLPLAWIGAAGALVIIAGGLALRHEPRRHTTEDDVVASYNAATAYEAIAKRAPASAGPESWRTPGDDLAVPPMVVPMTAVAPAPDVRPASLYSPLNTTPTPTTLSRPQPSAARASRQRGHASEAAPAAVSRRASATMKRSSAASSGNTSSTARSAATRTPRALPAERSPGRSHEAGHEAAPTERPALSPVMYPRATPAARPATAKRALDDMGLL